MHLRKELTRSLHSGSQIQQSYVGWVKERTLLEKRRSVTVLLYQLDKGFLSCHSDRQ